MAGKTRPYEYNHICTWLCIIQIYEIIPICHYVVDHTWCIPWWVEISECIRHPRGSLAIWRASLSYPSPFETYFDALRVPSVHDISDSMKNRLATWCARYVQLYECGLCVLIALRGIQHRLDSTGLHWAPLGSSDPGLACGLRGSPGLSWAAGLSWAIFWLGRALLEASVLFCVLLCSCGLCWARLGSYGLSWDTAAFSFQDVYIHTSICINIYIYISTPQ